MANKTIYTPFIRENNIELENPIDIKGYQRKYFTPEVQEEKKEDIKPTEVGTPVVSPIVEVRERSKPSTTQSTTKKSSTSSTKFSDKKSFVETMTPIYTKLLIQKGLNPLFAKSLVAQDALESAWGSKPAGRYNFGGVKGKGTNQRTREVINGKDVYINASFRDFDSLEDYANYKINLLNNNRYRAFSGDLTEFADRVARGGYATDPNYSSVLKRMVASVRQGGIIKAQDGNILKGKNWLLDWLYNRRDLLKWNIEKNAKFPVPFTSKLAYNLAAKNINNTIVEVDPSKMVADDVLGQFYPVRGLIQLRNNSTPTAIHEYTHASKPDAQIDEIDNIKDILGDRIYDNNTVPPDEYLDDSGEIYSRLMQLRYILNVDPNHKFTNEEIEALKDDKLLKTIISNRVDSNDKSFVVSTHDKNGNITSTESRSIGDRFNPEGASISRVYDETDSFNILNRYSTDFIRRLLNDVADNKTEVDFSKYAKKGMKL